MTTSLYPNISPDEVRRPVLHCHSHKDLDEHGIEETRVSLTIGPRLGLLDTNHLNAYNDLIPIYLGIFAGQSILKLVLLINGGRQHSRRTRGVEPLIMQIEQSAESVKSQYHIRSIIYENNRKS